MPALFGRSTVNATPVCTGSSSTGNNFGVGSGLEDEGGGVQLFFANKAPTLLPSEI